jgi:hypothetical protein
MDYLSLTKKFWTFNDVYPLSAPIVAIYLFLLDNWDKVGGKDFEFSDKVMSKRLKINRKTIKTSKDTLRNLGLINYQITKGFPTLYKIIPDYVIRKGKEVISVAEKEKTVSKKPIAQVISVMSPVQEAIPQSVQMTPPITPVAFPSLIPKAKERQVLKTPSNIPSLEEFISYAKTLDIYEEGLDVHLKIKYETWKDDGWVSGYNKPIVNWKQTLKNTMPYLRSNNKNIFNVPKINRPKSTYNE